MLSVIKIIYFIIINFKIYIKTKIFVKEKNPDIMNGLWIKCRIMGTKIIDFCEKKLFVKTNYYKFVLIIIILQLYQYYCYWGPWL